MLEFFNIKSQVFQVAAPALWIGGGHQRIGFESFVYWRLVLETEWIGISWNFLLNF